MAIDWTLLAEQIGPPLVPMIILAALSVFCALSLCKKLMRFIRGKEAGLLWEGPLLEWSAGVAQMLGLVGTCLGMLTALAHVKTGDPSSIRHLIGGMSHFLWSTATGLGISLLCSVLAFAAETLSSAAGGSHDPKD